MGAQKTIIVFLICLTIKSVSARSKTNFNITVAQSYLNKLPKDGLSFFRQFLQSLKDSGEYGECGEQVASLLTPPYFNAMKMFDAWSKVPSGVLWSSGVDFGSFDECLDINFQGKNKIRVMGKHCAYGIIIPYTTDLTRIATDSLKLAYCIPDKCNKTQMAKALKLNGTFIDQYLINEIFCTTKENNWEGPEIIVMAFILSIVLLIVVSTIYDVFLYYSKAETHPLYVAFSAYSNGKKLFHVTPNKGSQEQILAFHGMKFIGMFWIIAGHSGLIYYYLPLDNWHEGKDFLNQKYSAYLQTGHLAVDTFFFISGFLLAFLYFKTEAHKPVLKQVINVPLSIVYRYLRLTPAMLVVFLFYVYVQTRLVIGPSNFIQKAEMETCKNHWLAVFLYTQNYNNRNDTCMPQLWYVAADMQLFVFSFFLLIPLSIQYKKRQFKTIMVEMGLLCVVTAFLPIYTKVHWQDYDPVFNEFDTHSRIVDYVMGMTLAIFIRQGNYSLKRISFTNNILLWMLALSSMFASIVLNEAGFLSDDYVHKSVYLTLMRPLWCLGLIYITWACYNGRGGIINWILSCGFMQVGSRLTYAIYLIHLEVIEFWMTALRAPLHFSNFQLFYNWSGALVVSLFLSIFISLAFESPMITIEKFMFGKGGQSRKIAQTNNKQ